MHKHQYYYHDCPNRQEEIGLLISNYINNIEYYYTNYYIIIHFPFDEIKLFINIVKTKG